MKKLTFITMRLIAVMIVAVSSVAFFACGSDDDNNVDGSKGLHITGVILPPNVEVSAGGDITITGKGFAMGDKIRLVSTLDNTEHMIDVKSVTGNSVTFALPGGFPSGSYKMSVIRGTESVTLGSFYISIVVAVEIPDKEGMTVKGIVYSNGVGIPGVVVSDGYEVTKTDATGVYYLASEKKHGYVFISVPSGYEVRTQNTTPLFFAKVMGGTTVERKDFELTQADQSKYVVLAMTDLHLARRSSSNDLAQFNTRFMTDAKSVAEQAKAAGNRVYGITLGDLTWDAYWYDNKYYLSNFLDDIKPLGIPVFNAMGNHDNDGYKLGDWEAEKPFKEIVGPSYYSFNIGGVHYIVLDNVQYVNSGATGSSMGDRNYVRIIVSDQMAWLRKDLETVTDKNTPIVVATHCQIHNVGISSGSQTHSYSMTGAAGFLDLFNGFSEVHILTGHTHQNYNVKTANIYEHNTAAVCATWWWTGAPKHAGNHICKDGAPGGYGVYEVNGKDIKWYYKGMGHDKAVQFRTYDLNTVAITPEKFVPDGTEANKQKLAEYAGTYVAAGNNNEVLINIWNWDDDWTLEVKEGGNTLEYTRVYVKDPLHIASYEAQRLNNNASPTTDFVSNNNTHMFKVTAAGPTSTLTVKVTDRFGNVYNENMTRPKEFSLTMN